MSESRKFTKPVTSDLKEKLTSMQFKVTQKDGTEPPFKNEYWDNDRHGVYVDIISGEPLFCSKDKYESGTGWPSFTKPIEAESVSYKEERDFLLRKRTEVRSKVADSHLGHVFNDGPAESTGKRYCMNSAAMKFIPAEELDAYGLGHLKELFEVSTD